MRQPHEQQEIKQRIFRAWLKVPEMRLAQLIMNATYDAVKGRPDIFYLEDDQLADLVEAYAKMAESPNAHNPEPEKQKPRMIPYPGFRPYEEREEGKIHE